jgi:predicted ABC-type ATPase
MMIDSAYWEAEELAIESKRDLTVETNLRDDFLIDRAIYLKSKGYRINLIFILLPDVYTSIDRVNLRVDLHEHYVDMESVKYNFEHGLEMLRQHFNKFDTLILIDASLKDFFSIPKPLLICKYHTVDFVDKDPPSWAKPILDEIVQKLTTN